MHKSPRRRLQRRKRHPRAPAKLSPGSATPPLPRGQPTPTSTSADPRTPAQQSRHRHASTPPGLAAEPNEPPSTKNTAAASSPTRTPQLPTHQPPSRGRRPGNHNPPSPMTSPPKEPDQAHRSGAHITRSRGKGGPDQPTTSPQALPRWAGGQPKPPQGGYSQAATDLNRRKPEPHERDGAPAAT